MVAFLIVFGLLAFGCAVVGWATREAWTRQLVSEITRPEATVRSAVEPISAQPAGLPTATALPTAPVEHPVFEAEPTPASSEPSRHYAPAADPFAHAPPLSQGSATGLRH